MNTTAVAVARSDDRVYAVNTNDIPKCPNGWRIVRHRGDGMRRFNLAALTLHLESSQKGANLIRGYALYEHLPQGNLADATVLDFLLANRERIPQNWKGGGVKNELFPPRIFFWGTLYSRFDDKRCVRCLFWDGGRWCGGAAWLGHHWGVNDPAALQS